MKRFVIALILLAFSSFVFAQKVNVPEKAQAEFTKLYPKALDAKWTKENKNEYEVSFKEGTNECSASFDAKGKFLESEAEIQTTDLPKNAVDLIKKKHADHVISKAFKITDSKGVITFEAEITKGKKTKELLFDVSGKAIVKSKKENKEKK
jgi:hypothetical protein